MWSMWLRPEWVSDKDKKSPESFGGSGFFYVPLRLRLEDRLHLGKTKKTEFFLVFRSICTTFAADFKGCLLVQAEMIPSNLIRIMPA